MNKTTIQIVLNPIQSMAYDNYLSQDNIPEFIISLFFKFLQLHNLFCIGN